MYLCCSEICERQPCDFLLLAVDHFLYVLIGYNGLGFQDGPVCPVEGRLPDATKGTD
jgi:hypothetical protein